MQVQVPFLTSGGQVADRTVDAGRFRRRGKRVLLKEFVIMAEARQRVGTHKNLSRAEVNGTTKKMYRQKGTGSARHGNSKVPQLRGGGVAFAKRPRDYGYSMPKKARRAALEASLRAKLEDSEVRVIESFGIEQPSTRNFVALLERLGIDDSFMVVPAVHRDALWRSCRNVPRSSYRVVSDLNAYEVLKVRYLLLEEGALKALEERFGDD